MSVTNPVSHQFARVIELLTFGICDIFLTSKLKLLILLNLRLSETIFKSPPIRKFSLLKLKISLSRLAIKRGSWLNVGP